MNNNLIYKPKNAAAEYAPWACNPYNGCGHDCAYCYLKRGILKKQLGGSTPVIKKCFEGKTLQQCLQQFINALEYKKKQLVNDGGIFFSFTTDPCLPETIDLCSALMSEAVLRGVPVTLLTKRADWIYNGTMRFLIGNSLFCAGFTLTGRDDLEPNASSNEERIEAMQQLHTSGTKTFASIEPVIDCGNSLRMIQKTIGYCDLYRIGLMSGVGKDYYDKEEVARFFAKVTELQLKHNLNIYWKESVRKFAEGNSNLQELLKIHSVPVNYNIFNGQ